MENCIYIVASMEIHTYAPDTVYIIRLYVSSPLIYTAHHRTLFVGF